MNEEQNAAANGSETSEVTGKEPITTVSDPQPQNTSKGDNARTEDNYYSVDYAKKDVVSTIGDGEMHNEGLVGAGETTTDIQSSTERLSDEQDEAESHESEQ